VILAHLADLHLGYRGYGPESAGRNLRERDISRAFLAAVQELVRLRPDVIVIVGDLFDRPDPPATALVTAARGLETLRASLPETPVLMVAGARDTPRSWGDPGALGALDTVPGVEAATGTPRSVTIRGGEAHLLLLPHRTVLRHPRAEVTPDPDARWNVLAAYGSVGTPSGGEESGDARDAVAVRAGAWDYVALGSSHRKTSPAPGAADPGSLERVGPEPWSETLEAKGFLTVDLEEGGEPRFHEISGRPVVALAPILWEPGRPERMNERIHEVSEEVPGGLDGKIVRLRLEGLGPEALERLDSDLLRRLRAQAFHLAVEVAGDGEEGGRPLPRAEEVVRDLASGTEPAVVELALRASEAGRVGGAEGEEGEALRISELESDGREELLGTFRLRPGEGLVGWTGGEARHRKAFSELLRRRAGLDRRRDEGGGGGGGESGPPGRGRREISPAPRRRDLGLIWGGWGVSGPDELLEHGARAVARMRGLGRLEEGVRLLGGDPGWGGGEGDEARLVAELEEVERRLDELRDVPGRLRTLEEELQARRAESAEVAGDLEVETMEWLRERQDAETHLRTYRDRARELRTRIRELEGAGARSPCPYCGRVLGERCAEVLAELRGEWEKLVQDGRWWRRRREQLELKPSSLRELESRSMRLQAEVEGWAERLERCRFDLRERDELRARREEIRSTLGDGAERELPDGPAPESEDHRSSALRLLHEAGEELLTSARAGILRAAGPHLNRISGGRLLGLVEGEGGRVEAVEDGCRVSGATHEDRAAVHLALRLAIAIRARTEGLPLESLVVAEPFDGIELQARLRAVELFRSLRGCFPRIFLVAGPEVAEGAPDRFDEIIEVRGAQGGRGRVLRLRPGGVGELRLEG